MLSYMNQQPHKRYLIRCYKALVKKARGLGCIVEDRRVLGTCFFLSRKGSYVAISLHPWINPKNHLDHLHVLAHEMGHAFDFIDGKFKRSIAPSESKANARANKILVSLFGIHIKE